MSPSNARTYYLNADFDLTLRPRPRQAERPALVRQVRELSLQALLGAAGDEAALVRADVPPSFIDHLHECGLETPRLLMHPRIDAETRFEPFGWSREAIALNRRHSRPSEHPPWDSVRRVNARSFAQDLEAELSPESPVGTVVDTLEQLEAFVAAAAPQSDWVVKSEHGHSGMANRRLRGTHLTPTDRRFVTERLAEDDRLVVEPWLRREHDCCAIFEAPFQAAGFRLHETVYTSDGALIGALFDPETEHRAPYRELEDAAAWVAERVTCEGYFGPVCLDAFTWRDGTRSRLRPLVDLNCRRSMSDGAHRLWRRLAPRRTLYYRFFNRRKLNLPAEMTRAVAALGNDGYDRSEQRGVLLASPLRVGLDGEWRPPTKLAVAFVARERQEVIALEQAFRRRFEV